MSTFLIIGMRNSFFLWSISLASQGQYMEILKTLEPHGIFGTFFYYFFHINNLSVFYFIIIIYLRSYITYIIIYTY